MGLRGFGPWLRSTFPSAFLNLAHSMPAPYNAVHIDANTLLYTFARQTDSPRRVLQCTMSYLHNLLAERCRPVDRLVLAIDGAASVPKLAVQRSRRRQNGDRADRNGMFDCRQLTPGCMFMWEFGEMAAIWSSRWLKSQLLPPSCQVIVDPVTRAGEGEHKILQDIYAHSRPGDRIAIVTSDSDLFLYPLLFPSDRTVDIHIPFVDLDTRCVLSINTLRELMLKMIGNDQCISDIFILALLSGNDYCPAVPWAAMRSTFPNYLEHVRSGRHSGPFYSLPKKRFYANNLKHFLKAHNQTINRFEHPDYPTPRLFDSVPNYLGVMGWTMQQIEDRRDEKPNVLVDMPTPKGINLETLIEADYTKTAFSTTAVKYVPGAIGMSLLSPDRGARQFLPKALQALEGPGLAEWWSLEAPGSLLHHYNQLIDSVRDRMTDRERAAVDPGDIKIVTVDSARLHGNNNINNINKA